MGGQRAAGGRGSAGWAARGQPRRRRGARAAHPRQTGDDEAQPAKTTRKPARGRGSPAKAPSGTRATENASDGRPPSETRPPHEADAAREQAERKAQQEGRRKRGQAEAAIGGDGVGTAGRRVAGELRRRETRLAKIKEAKKVLDNGAGQGRREGKSAAGQAGDKDQYNFTDPESRIMKGATDVQGYNAQAAADRLLLTSGKR